MAAKEIILSHTWRNDVTKPPHPALHHIVQLDYDYRIRSGCVSDLKMFLYSDEAKGYWAWFTDRNSQVSLFAFSDAHTAFACKMKFG